MRYVLFLLGAVLPLLADFKPDLKENLTHVRKYVKNNSNNCINFYQNPNIQGGNSCDFGYKMMDLGRPWVNGWYLPYTRIPALTITNKNHIVAMFDLRYNGNSDHDSIDIGAAVSKDGGYSFDRYTAIEFNEDRDSKRCVMDTTILHNPVDDSIYALHQTMTKCERNWVRAKHENFNNNIWAAQIRKSYNSGASWDLVKKYSSSNANEFKSIEFKGNTPLAFLGGVGSGIMTSDGTLVFPIQTAHHNGIATTIMYSKDLGTTWEFPENKVLTAHNQVSLENMVFEIDGKLVMTGRESASNLSSKTTSDPQKQKGKRWAYESSDLGKTWTRWDKIDNLPKTTAYPSQGSTIYGSLKSGRKVLLISKPDGLLMQRVREDILYTRGFLTLYVLDGKNKSNFYKVGVIRPGFGNHKGAGYSSLVMKEGNLFVAYEDDGNITLENLTNRKDNNTGGDRLKYQGKTYMEIIEAKAQEWNLQDQRATDKGKIDTKTYLNKAQSDALKAMIDRANDDALPISVWLNKGMESLKQDSAKLGAEKSRKNTRSFHMLPSRIRLFKQVKSYVDSVTNTKSSVFLDYLRIKYLQRMLNNRFADLSDRLDFDYYKQAIKALDYYNNDILNNDFSSSAFANFSAGYGDIRLALGANFPQITFNELYQSLILGAFFEHERGDLKLFSFGLRAKVLEENDSVYKAFVRLRFNKKDKDIIAQEYAKWLETYVSYAYNIKFTDVTSIYPSIGFSYSGGLNYLFDEDLKLSNLHSFGFEAGLNFDYKLKWFDLSITPKVGLIAHIKTLAQSNFSLNYKTNRYLQGISQLEINVRKQIKDFSLSQQIKLRKHSGQRGGVDFGVGMGYKF